MKKLYAIILFCGFLFELQAQASHPKIMPHSPISSNSKETNSEFHLSFIVALSL